MIINLLARFVVRKSGNLTQGWYAYFLHIQRCHLVNHLGWWYPNRYQ